MDGPDELPQQVDALRRELVGLAAESLAVQLVLACLLSRVADFAPGLRAAVIQAFDEAADRAERLSVATGRNASHLTETLRVIEGLRLMLVGRDKPRHQV